MNGKRLLRWLIISQWLLLVAAIGAKSIENSHLQDQLKSYLLQSPPDLKFYKFISFLDWLFSLVYLVSSIGLFINKKEARWGYLCGFIGMIVVTLFGGPEISTPVSGVLNGLCSLSIGLTIGLLYLPHTRVLSDSTEIRGVTVQTTELPSTELPVIESSFFADFLRNIKSGFRASVFMKVGKDDFRISYSQLPALLFLNMFISVLVSFIFVGTKGTFEYSHIPNAVFYVCVILLMAFCVARSESRPELALAILIAMVSIIIPVMSIGSLLKGVVNNEWPRLAFLFSGSHYFDLFIWWGISSYMALVRIVRPVQRPRLLKLYFFLFSIIPFWFVPRWDLWVPPYQDDERAENSIAKEEIFYAQPVLLEQKLASLKPGRKGIIDMYFVGFGGDSSQDVFMKEVDTITKLFDERFETAGRSIELINNARTVSQAPIATRTSLERTINRIGKLMNKGEDIIFVYLSSHGSSKFKLSVDFWPLELNEVAPEDLKKILSGSGIKWKVVVISACYSGGFIDALKDEDTVVITASDEKSSSFGCGNDSDFTYFGKAYFDEALRNSYSFIKPFDSVKNSIRKWEISESKKPSNPQLFVGSRIRKQLEKLEFRLKMAHGFKST